jgi:hypothetical protein
MIWVDAKYDTSQSYTTITNSQRYSDHSNFDYNTLDLIGNHVLIFNDIAEDKKLAIWQESSLKEEMISFSPNIQLMEEFFQDRVEDNGVFKRKFLNYMQESHDEYVGTLITKEEFDEKILNPSF